MKNWTKAEIVELNIMATAQTPTTEMSVDEFVNGYFKQGTGSGSGPKREIDYYPQG